MNPTDAYREKIGDRLTRRLAGALENGEIDRDQLAEISSYILDNIDNAKTNSELLSFLDNLSAQWPFLSDMATEEKNLANQSEQNEKVSQIGELISENKIDDALKIAKDSNDAQSQGGIS